jgi:hypothetical protein
MKTTGTEQGAVEGGRMDLYENEYVRLLKSLEDAGTQSNLPEESDAKAGLHDLLVRIRLGKGRPI